MDISLLIRQRLTELGLGQKDLAAAAEVTESYISQLLSRKKAPPAPARTDIYEKIGQALKLPGGELAKLAEAQRRMELQKKVAEPPGPLLGDCRRLILRKCGVGRQSEVRRIFEKEAFGELERLVTQKILDSAQGLAREELRNEEWLRLTADLSGRSYEEMRVALLEFLDSDVYHVSGDACVSFLDPMIDSWDIDLIAFDLEVTLNPRLASGGKRRFAFVEIPVGHPPDIEPGLEDFLGNKSLSGDATIGEIEFLRALGFRSKRPNPLYYYRELQNLRDPLHFSDAGKPGVEPRGESPGARSDRTGPRERAQ